MARIPKDLSFSNADNERIPYPFREANMIRRASKSFENLIALANDQERIKEMSEAARKVVWRDTGEAPVLLHTYRMCLEHAAKGALRAGMLAGAIRSGVNVVLLLFRILRAPKRFRYTMVLHALFGEDSWRFAGMLGSFTFIYKFLINALPLVPIPDQLAILRSSRQRAQRQRERDLESGGAFDLDSPPSGASGSGSGMQTPLMMSSKHAEKRAQEIMRKRRGSHLSMSSEVVYSRLSGARWHAAFAGAVAGLSVLFEKKSRRITVAQQLFVRGLQGSWNAWSPRLGIKVPYGSVWVFTLACGPIMYAFLLRPSAIPKSYDNWILRASKVHAETMVLNRDLVRNGKFDVPVLEALMAKRGNTPRNMTALASMLEAAKKGDFQGRHAAPCEIIHPWLDSCTYVEIERFVSVFTWMFPVYGALHVIPMILFKRKVFMQQPLAMLLRSLKGTVRSSTFLSVFVFIYQSLLCLKNQLHFSDWAAEHLKLPPRIRQALISRGSFWVLAFSVGLSLFVEEERRRAELAMYVLPRGLESAWSMMRGRGYVPFIPFGDSILSMAATGMVMATYQNDPEHLSGLVRRILYQFVGPN